MFILVWSPSCLCLELRTERPSLCLQWEINEGNGGHRPTELAVCKEDDLGGCRAKFSSLPLHTDENPFLKNMSFKLMSGKPRGLTCPMHSYELSPWRESKTNTSEALGEAGFELEDSDSWAISRIVRTTLPVALPLTRPLAQAVLHLDESGGLREGDHYYTQKT